MSLRSLGAISVAGYRARTGDTTTGSGDVESALDDAELEVAEHLRRTVDGGSGLAADDYETRLRIHPDGRVFPPAYPVTASDDLTVESTRVLLGATPDGGPFIGYFPQTSRPPRATVAWSGGYTAPGGAHPLPAALSDAIYDVAHVRATETSPVPVGATSVRLGDAAVTYGPGAVATGLDTLVPGISNRIARYRNRLGDGMA